MLKLTTYYNRTVVLKAQKTHHVENLFSPTPGEVFKIAMILKRGFLILTNLQLQSWNSIFLN